MEKRSRGRPREYDRSEALGDAINVFAEKGYSATSLDDLALATGMNRPSLYNAFGNKESLYRASLAEFVSHLRAEIGRSLIGEPDLSKALTAFYRGALDQYFSVTPSRGCFFFCTAPVEVITHPEIQGDMKALMRELDEVLEAKFKQARDAGDLPADFDTVAGARTAQGILHSIAIRARAGEAKTDLLDIARFAVSLLTQTT